MTKNKIAVLWLKISSKTSPSMRFCSLCLCGTWRDATSWGSEQERSSRQMKMAAGKRKQQLGPMG